MPDAVRVSLGIPPRAEDFQREGRTTGDGRDADPRYREGPGGPPRDYPRERY